MSAALRFDPNNLRSWLHRIEETFQGGDFVKQAALAALRGEPAPAGPGLLNESPKADGAAIEPTVSVVMPLALAKQLDAELADFLCWTAGFKAARPDDTTHHPMGVQGARNTRDALRRAIEQAGF